MTKEQTESDKSEDENKNEGIKEGLRTAEKLMVICRIVIIQMKIEKEETNCNT